MSVSIEINDIEIIAAIEDVINAEFKERLAAALRNACLKVERDAKKNCPVGDGNLRQSITHEIDNEELEGAVGTNCEYAPYVEIGTGIYSSQGNGRQTPWVYYDEKHDRFVTTRGMEPQPFLEPALESNRGNIESYFQGII